MNGMFDMKGKLLDLLDDMTDTWLAGERNGELASEMLGYLCCVSDVYRAITKGEQEDVSDRK